MAKSRDRVKELLEIKTRNKDHSRYPIYFARVQALKGALRGEGFDEEVLRYFPIGMIACMEAYFRTSYAEMLDKGEPYASRADPLVKDLKIDWRAVRAIEGRTVSSGELIAHSLAFNNLGDIEVVMDTLNGGDFRTLLKKAQRIHWIPLSDLGKERNLDPILLDPDVTFRHVVRAFELRHIFCHESATNIALTKQELQDLMHHCERFLIATEEVICGVLNPDAPMTQSEMERRAATEYAKAEAAMTAAISLLLEKLDEENVKRAFELAQRNWEAFAKADAEMAAFLYRGGKIHPTIVYGALEERAKERTNHIKALIKEWSFDNL